LNKDAVHRVWAPSEAVWSRWVKPVLFAFADSVLEAPTAGSERLQTAARIQTGWLPSSGSYAIVVDVPGEEGVMYGLELARRRYRPIPLQRAPFAAERKVDAASSAIHNDRGGNADPGCDLPRNCYPQEDPPVSSRPSGISSGCRPAHRPHRSRAWNLRQSFRLLRDRLPFRRLPARACHRQCDRPAKGLGHRRRLSANPAFMATRRRTHLPKTNRRRHFSALSRRAATVFAASSLVSHQRRAQPPTRRTRRIRFHRAVGWLISVVAF